MKNLRAFAAFIILFTLIITSCADENKYTIKGEVHSSQLEGVKVFMVPCNPNLLSLSSKIFVDSIGLDSAVIKDGKFEFSGKGEFLARITLDIKHRYGTQDLLVVAEPGSVAFVVIDSVSHGGGTPQNEILQQWKDKKSIHDAVVRNQLNHCQSLLQTGDTTYANALNDSIKMYNEAFGKEMVELAKIAGRGPAYELLVRRYAVPDSVR